MRKIKLILLVILLLLVVNVKAEDRCDSKEFARLKELAKKIEYDYDYKLVNDDAVFSINLVNVTEELKAVIENSSFGSYKEFKRYSDGSATLDGFEAGQKVTITIKAFVPNWCSGKNVTTKIIRLPYYNAYYDEEKCKGHEDFKYCKRLIDSKISQSDFDKQYELYLKRTETTQDNPVTPTSNTKLYIIIVIALIAISVISATVITIIKRRKKNML